MFHDISSKKGEDTGRPVIQAHAIDARNLQFLQEEPLRPQMVRSPLGEFIFPPTFYRTSLRRFSLFL